MKSIFIDIIDGENFNLDADNCHQIYISMYNW